MGLIVNKPLEDLSFSGLLEHLNIPLGPEGRDIRVHFGGPVERGRGFVLHSSDWRPLGEGTMQVPGGLEMTATINVLEALASGGGPGKALLALGYSGWGPGQLESEIDEKAWMVTEICSEKIFENKSVTFWREVLRDMGGNFKVMANYPIDPRLN